MNKGQPCIARFTVEISLAPTLYRKLKSQNRYMENGSTLDTIYIILFTINALTNNGQNYIHLQFGLKLSG